MCIYIYIVFKFVYVDSYQASQSNLKRKQRWEVGVFQVVRSHHDQPLFGVPPRPSQQCQQQNKEIYNRNMKTGKQYIVFVDSYWFLHSKPYNWIQLGEANQ